MPHARVDVPSHSLVPAYREALAAAGTTSFHGMPVPAWSPELALGFVDAHDIAIQLLSVFDPGVSFVPDDAAANALARAVNEQVATPRGRAPHALRGLRRGQLREVAAVTTEAVRCLDTLGFDGVGLLSSAAGRYLGDPANAPLLEALDERAAWMFVHLQLDRR